MTYYPDNGVICNHKLYTSYGDTAVTYKKDECPKCRGVGWYREAVLPTNMEWLDSRIMEITGYASI